MGTPLPNRIFLDEHGAWVSMQTRVGAKMPVRARIQVHSDGFDEWIVITFDHGEVVTRHTVSNQIEIGCEIGSEEL